MGAFIGILFILLTIIYQSVSLEYDFINEKKNQHFQKKIEKDIVEDFYKLSKIEETSLSQTYTKFNFINNNCNDNYSKILICQKRHALKVIEIEDSDLNPSKEFCKSFYNYVKYKKGINGRITISEVKELLLSVNTLNSNSTSNNEFILDRMNDETNEGSNKDFIDFDMEDFTTAEITNEAQVNKYKQEFKTYNLRKYNNYFRATDDYNENLIHERSVHPFSYKILIRSSVRNNKILFDGNIVKFYAILEDHSREKVKIEGVKTFINTYFDKILKYREILLKIKRISPEIDLFMEKIYNNKTEIIIKKLKYQKTYEDFYLKYKGLLRVLKISDNDFFINEGNVDIKALKNDYKINNLLDSFSDFENFVFTGITYNTPFSSRTKRKLNTQERRELKYKEVCDLKRYIKEEEY